MKPEIAHEWAEWLLSNPDLQGRGALLRDGKYCCLGVLCEVAMHNGLKLKTTIDSQGFTRFNDKAGMPPREVNDFVGIKSKCPTWNTNEEIVKLMSLNDYGEACFEVIAKEILHKAEEL